MVTRLPRKAVVPTGLARQVMRRATWVGLGTLLLAAVLGLLRASDNMQDEVDAAMSLADVVARLGQLADVDDRSAITELRALQIKAPLRHLELRVFDAQARLLLGPPPPRTPPAWLDTLYRLHRHLVADTDRRMATWTVPRPNGGPWRVSLSSSHDSERREAVDDLLGMLAVLGAGIAALLLVMQANVRHALRPLGALLLAIRNIEAPDHQAADAVRALPAAMPIHELDVVAAALRHLAQALDEASAQRRALSQKVLSLQEDERAHLARELHDEFGQRLTALRLDAAWLQRQLADDDSAAHADPAALRTVVNDMAARCAEVQADIRGMLVRLRPLGGSAAGQTISWAEFTGQLDALVQSWRGTAARGAGELATHFIWRPGPGVAGAPASIGRDPALAVYRLSQEALTNVARHARASHAELSLDWQAAPDEPATGDTAGTPTQTRGITPGTTPDATPVATAGWLIWQVRDDGIGITDPARAVQRGNGLGGMQERVWALGGSWQMSAARLPGQGSNIPRGLLLRATLPSGDAPAAELTVPAMAAGDSPHDPPLGSSVAARGSIRAPVHQHSQAPAAT